MPKYKVRVIITNIDNESGDDSDDRVIEVEIEANNRFDIIRFNGNPVVEIQDTL